MFVAQEIDHRSGLPCSQGAQLSCQTFMASPGSTPVRRVSAPHGIRVSLGCKIRCSSLSRHLAFSEFMRSLASCTSSTAQHNGKSTCQRQPRSVKGQIAQHFSHVNGDLYIPNGVRAFKAALNAMLSTSTPHQWDQTKTIIMRYQLRVLPVFDDDGTIQMLTQEPRELAAYQVFTTDECVPSRSKTALSSGGYGKAVPHGRKLPRSWCRLLHLLQQLQSQSFH